MTASLTIIRANEFLVCAADSCVSDGLDRHIETKCKIVRIGEFAHVANKFASHSETGYDVYEILERTSNVKSIDAWAEALKLAVVNPLTIALVFQRIQNRTAFVERFSSRTALGVSLIGIEKETPVLVNLNFKVKDLTGPTIELEIETCRCPGPDCPAGVAMVTVVHNKEEFVPRFEQDFPDYWLGDVDRVGQNAEAFVQRAINEKIPGVGLPISVLVVTANGFDWRKPGSCGAT